jgi:hypothetical protein
MSTQIAAITISQIALLGLVIWVVAGRLQERARLRMELQVRMLERFASPAELKDFLQSEGGRRLLGALSPRQTVAPRMLLAVQAGVIVTIIGIGVQMTGNMDLLEAGIVIVALGLGLILSTAVAWFLARMWGLLPRADEHGDR